jgi:Skp family chaperone for outer membrane proteins
MPGILQPWRKNDRREASETGRGDTNMANTVRLALLVLALAFVSVARQATAGEGALLVVPETATRKATEAVDAAKESTMREKEAFQKNIQEELDEFQAQIARLRTRTDQASAEARAKAQHAIADLEKKKEAARRQLEELKSAGASAWAD